MELLLTLIERSSIGSIEVVNRPVWPELPDRTWKPTGSERSPKGRRRLVHADSRNESQLVVEAIADRRVPPVYSPLAVSVFRARPGRHLVPRTRHCARRC